MLIDKDDVILRNGILHILDTNLPAPVLSDYLLDLTDDTKDLLRNQIYSLATMDEAKDCQFDEENSEFFKALYGFSESDLTGFSKAASEQMYKLLHENAAIPSGDLFFVTCQIKSVMYLAILKMNYKAALVHQTAPQEQGQYNGIMRHAGALPSISSRPSEGVLINLAEYTLRVIEKKVEIDGQKQYYLSSLFLGCKGKISQKAKMDIVTKAVQKLNEEYHENDFEKQMEAKSILKTEITSETGLSLSSIPEKLFPEEPEIQEKLQEALQEYHIEKEEIRPINEKTTKKLEKQFLVTDTGIEINIPMEQYQNSSQVEFISNEDGTISVLIKNIAHLRTK